MAQEATREKEPDREPSLECAHHWLIEPPSGETSRGTCLKCGAVQDFRNSVPPKGWNGQRPKAGRSR